MRKFWPECIDKDIEKVLESRNAKVLKTDDGNKDPLIFKHKGMFKIMMEDLVDDGLVDEIRSMQEEKQKADMRAHEKVFEFRKAQAEKEKTTNAKASSSSSGGAGGGGLGEGGAAAKPKARSRKEGTHLPWDQCVPYAGSSYSQADAQRFKPPNIHLEKDIVRHKRWRVTGNGVLMTGVSKSKSYGDESVISDYSAMCFVLEYAWAQTTRILGIHCPWEFGRADGTVTRTDDEVA